MLEKIFELADKCDKRDTTIRKKPDIYQDGTIRYVFDMDSMPYSDESDKAQNALIDFLLKNCHYCEEDFMFFVCHFNGFEVEIDYYD